MVPSDEGALFIHVSITVDSFQYIDVIIAEPFKEKFKNYDDEIVALSVNYKIENKSYAAMNTEYTESKLLVDDRGSVLESGLSPRAQNDVLKPGESAEILGLYLFNKDEFGIVDSLTIEYGAIRDEKLKDISKGQTISIDMELPKK